MTNAPEININYKVQYLAFQLFGWGALTVLIAIFNLKTYGMSLPFIFFLLSILGSNLLLSHFYRYWVNKKEWILKPIGQLLLRILISSIILGFLYSVAISCSIFILNQVSGISLQIDNIVFGTIVYFIWSILYFGYLLFYKARRVEFKNMQILALNTEAELKNLRSQLNPHFMFNAMNSIRALVDENPEQSKKAITQLSNVLRSALVHSKKNLITLKEEMNLVDDYLSLEKIRYEERLQVVKNIEPECLVISVPPLLIQTITENAIKHGISKLMNGGVITYDIKKLDNYLSIVISNTGQIDMSHASETGIGVQNTIKRLRLIYGNDATFDLRQVGKEVKTELLLLLKNNS